MAFLPHLHLRRTTFRNPSIKPTTPSSPHFFISHNQTNFRKWSFSISVALYLGLLLSGVGLAEAKVGVNKPELLPKDFTPVIDVAGFLSSGQEKRIAQEIADIEKDTGFKLRVLTQNYPDTPGLAIEDYWQVDDRTIVFVADPTFGNILNFNMGESVDIDIPHSFWSRLADASIEAAVMAISNCLREPVGPNNCSENGGIGRTEQELTPQWRENRQISLQNRYH